MLPRAGASSPLSRAGLASLALGSEIELAPSELATADDPLEPRPAAPRAPRVISSTDYRPVAPIQMLADTLATMPPAFQLAALPDDSVTKAPTTPEDEDAAKEAVGPSAGAPRMLFEPPRRRRSDPSSGPRLRRILADQSNQPVASGLLHLDPILVALADSERHFRTLIEQAADGIVVVDSIGRITLANSRACEMLGYSPAEIVGLDLLDTYQPEDRELGRDSLNQAPGTSLRIERMLRRHDGTSIPIDVSVAWLGNGERQLIMRDVTARQLAEEAQLAEERRLRSLLRISEVDCGSVPELLNVTLAEVVALSESAFGYIYAYDETADAYTLHSWSRDAGEASQIADPKWTYELARSGIWDEVESQRKPIVINELETIEAAEPASDDGVAPVARFMTIPVISHDQIVAVVGVANKAEPYTDTDANQLTQIMDVVWKIADRQQHEDRLRRFAEQMESRVEQRTREYELAHAELEAANTEIAAANQELQKLLSEQERLQSELAYRALHDPLTGLANRTMFQERLDYAFRVSERGVGVLWIDLDNFKKVNDIFGHDVGDEMLVAVADRLRDVVRDTDDIARMGGDEFAVVLPNVVESEARVVADRVLASLSERESFRLQVGVSVGVAWQRNAIGDARALVRRADQAMYRAKAAGGGQSVM
jgi:diguanylate cyclase (GGDEF)-like protein/PAS domain S-box-containing protein